MMMKQTINLYLIGMSFVYLFVFTSIYTKIPELYGDHGLLPIHHVFSFGADSESLWQLFLEKPNLLWIFKPIGLNEEMSLELMTLAAILISFLSIMFNPMRSTLTFFFLWSCYYSICKVGQTIMWFQWDLLLLESGFLTTLLASMIPRPNTLEECKERTDYSNLVYNGNYWEPRNNEHANSHANMKSLELSEEEEDPSLNIGLWLVKWLCFRLMLASGLVKLTSDLPSYWNLDVDKTISWHYDIESIWDTITGANYQSPNYLLVATLVNQSLFPFLFFSPLRLHRLISGYAQVFLMVLMFLTGYTYINVFNVHIVILHICLADDKHFGFEEPRKETRSTLGLLLSLGKFILLLLPFVIAINDFIALCGLDFKLLQISSSMISFKISGKITFSKEQFFTWLAPVILFAFSIAIASFYLTTLNSLRKCLFARSNWAIPKTIFSIIASVYFIANFGPDFEKDHTNCNNFDWPTPHQWHYGRRSVYGTNSLSRRVVGNRLEVVIKGSNYLEKGWKEYDFMYKMGDIKRAPPFLVPHQPRLDWKLWFSAIAFHGYNPHLVHLACKILTGEPEVLDLLNQPTPFVKPPKYVKIDLHIYNHTSISQNSNWLTRKIISEYIPPMTKDSPQFLGYLAKLGFRDMRTESPMTSHQAIWFKKVRSFVNENFKPFQLFLTALLLLLKKLNIY